MPAGAKLAITELRQGSRFPVLHAAACEHRLLGDIVLPLRNLSRVGFMVEARSGVERGDRLMIRLPAAVRLEAFCIWTSHQRAGFQFERPIRPDAFVCMKGALNGKHLRQIA